MKEATNLLLNRIADTYQKLAGGALSWDAIILAGGGSALLYKRLLPILNHNLVNGTRVFQIPQLQMPSWIVLSIMLTVFP